MQPASPILRYTLVFVLVCVTAVMFHKQWQYYFVRKGVKGGIFYHTLRAMNYPELTLDVLLSLWGGMLMFVAFRLPSMWLLTACVYFLLVVARCKITLMRASFARRLEKQGTTAVRSCPFLTDVGPLLLGRSTVPREQALRMMRKSVTEWSHVGEGTKTPTRHILAGWWWSDRIHAATAGAGFAMSLPTTWLTRNGQLHFVVPFALTLVATLAVGIAFRLLSAPSLRWGEAHASELM